MRMRVYLCLLSAVLIPCASQAIEKEGPHTEIADICVESPDPLACMASYGFRCHKNPKPFESREAYSLGCNLDLTDGHYHFVQLLNDGQAWSIDNQRTYLADRSDYSERNKAGFVLDEYLRDQMKGYGSFMSGAGSSSEGWSIRYDTGGRRNGDGLHIRAVCGTIIDPMNHYASALNIQPHCEENLLRTMRKLSQAPDTSPYRVAGPSEIEWSKRTVTLVSGDSAFIIEGKYTLRKGLPSCLWISDCCSREGSTYLDSCRTPTASEMKVIESCLGTGDGYRSEQYLACLRDANVKVGCEEQPDGSRICY